MNSYTLASYGIPAVAFIPPSFPDFPTTSLNLKHDSGFAGFVDYSYIMNKHISFGIEAGYRQTQMKDNENGSFVESDIVSGMLNARGSLDFTTFFQPYIMAGVGIARTRFEGAISNPTLAEVQGLPIEDATIFFSDFKTMNAAFQVGVGLQFLFNNVAIGIGYKLFTVVDSFNDNDSSTVVRYQGRTLGAPSDFRHSAFRNTTHNISATIRAAV